MPENIYQKFGELIERNDQYRWLGSGGLLGDRNSGFSGVRIFAKYVFDKKQRDINALNAPHSDNKLCLEFIEYLGEKAKESTDDGMKKQYEEMASKSLNMLRPGGNGQMNDSIFVEYATAFYQLGIGSDKETIVAKFMEALEMVKREKPALSKRVEGITSPIPQKMEPKEGQAGLTPSGESKPLETEGAETEESIDFSEEGEQDSSLDISSEEKAEAKAEIINPQEAQIQEPLTEEPEEELEERTEEELENPEEDLEKEEREGPLPVGGLLIPDEGELDQETQVNPLEEPNGTRKEDEREKLQPKGEEKKPEDHVEEKRGVKEEIPQPQRRRVQREKTPTSVPNLSETRLQEPIYPTDKKPVFHTGRKGERKRGKRGRKMQRKTAETNERMRGLPEGNQQQMVSSEARQTPRANQPSGGAKIAKRALKIGGGIGALIGISAAGGSEKAAEKVAAMTFALIKILF